MRDPRLLLLLALAGCPRAPLPAHLQPESAEVVASRPVTSRDDLLAALLRGDPLARSQPRVDLDTAARFDPDLAAWLAAAAGPDAEERARQLGHGEASVRGTAAVALGRGRRLARAERLLADPTADEQTARQITALLTPLTDPDRGAAQVVRSPLDVFAGQGSARSRALAAADPWVLAGWLDGPGIPLGPVADALDAPMHDRLRLMPLGALIQARARNADGPAEAGWADLERATTLALAQAAADRDKEQAAWRERRASVAAELGAEDPVRALLSRARPALTAAAQDDRAAGGAVVAIHAERLAESCATCGGLDRVDGLGAAARWHPDAGRLGALWQVVATKQALDHLDVALHRPTFPQALLDLLDALLGVGAGPFPVAVVERGSPGPALWLDLSRGLDLESTDEAEVRAALGAHLRTLAELALSTEDDPERREILTRIARRAG